MAAETLDIQWPLGGNNSALAFQSQPPYTTPRSLNCWPRDQFENRMRGGSRPGMNTVFPSGVTGPVHLLANVRTIEASGSGSSQVWREDTFPGGSEPLPLWGTWANAFWLNSQYLLYRQNNYARLRLPGGMPYTTSGVVYSYLAMDTSESYTISLDGLGPYYQYNPYNWQLAKVQNTISIFLRMSNANPNVLNEGVNVTLNVVINDQSSGYYVAYLEITDYAAGIASMIFPGQVAGFLPLSLKVKDAGTSLYIEWGQPLSMAHYTHVPHAVPVYHQRFGIGAGLAASATIGGTLVDCETRIDNFKVRYKGAPLTSNRNIVVAAGGTNSGTGSLLDIKFEDIGDTLSTPTSIAASIKNPNARHLQATELLGKLYIVGEDGTDQSIWVFDAAASSGGGSIAALAATDTGTVPKSTSWICAWRNRLVTGGAYSVFTGTTVDPQNVSMSGVGQPQHWNYASIPIGSPCLLNTTGIDTGRLGEPTTCGIAHSDDYLILGCQASLYVLRGDPTYGGQIDRLSSAIGIASAQAWARGPNGETLLLSSDGLYELPAGVMAYPKSASREQLPMALRDVNVEQYRILMAYDNRNRGVFVGLTPMTGSGGIYYWLDWEQRGFWPMEFDSSMEPTSLVFRNSDAAQDRVLLLGCRDGNIRCFNDRMFTDDGLNRKTEILIGPIALGGGGYRDGILLEVIGQTSLNSGNVDCAIKVGDSIEAAYNAVERSQFVLRPGKNVTTHPRLRGNTAFVKLYTSENVGWALENMTIVRERLGKQRLL